MTDQGQNGTGPSQSFGKGTNDSQGESSSSSNDFKTRFLNKLNKKLGSSGGQESDQTNEDKEQRKQQKKEDKEQKKQQKKKEKEQNKQQEENVDDQQQGMDQQEQKEDEQQQEQDIDERIQQIKDNLDKKKKKYEEKKKEKQKYIDNGPHGIVKFFSKGIFPFVLFFIILADTILNLLQALISWVSGALAAIPVIGWLVVALQQVADKAIDVVEASVYGGIAILFAIPTIIFLRDIGSFFKIAFFFVFDIVVSYVPMMGDFIDAIFEWVVKKIKRDFYQPRVLQLSYDKTKEPRKNKLEQKYGALKAKAENQADEDIEDLKKKLENTGKAKLKRSFRGPGSTFFYIILMVLILLTGPLVAGWVSLDLSFITIVTVVVFALIITLLAKFDLFENDKLYSLITFFVLNFITDLLLSDTGSNLIGSGDLAWVSFAVLGIGYMGVFLWGVAPQYAITIPLVLILILVLAASFPTFKAEVQSGSMSKSVDASKAETEASLKNLDPIGSFMDFIDRQYGPGNGTTNVESGEVQQTSEYIGAEIEAVTPTRETFYSDEPVALDIDTKANSYHPIGIMTFCNVDNKVAKVDPRYTELTGSKSARVRCTFDNLREGSHVVDVQQSYRYKSSVEVPIQIMTEKKQDTMLGLAEDAGDGYMPNEFFEFEFKAISTSGPIRFNVGNARDGTKQVLEMPIIVDREKPNKNRRVNFMFQLDNAGSTKKGEVGQINKLTISTPEGIGLENCDFTPSSGRLTHKQDGERWVHTFDDEFKSWDTFDAIACDLYFDKTELHDQFGEQGWFFDKIFLTMNYNYKMEHASTVRVVE